MREGREKEYEAKECMLGMFAKQPKLSKRLLRRFDNITTSTFAYIQQMVRKIRSKRSL